MIDRRKFLKDSLIASVGAVSVISSPKLFSGQDEKSDSAQNLKENPSLPIVISTWKHGIPANEAAWKTIINNGRALDAVEKGVRVPESDPKVQSVGYGGLPDRDGYVTLDACIMDEKGNCGSVACIQHIKHPISVARLVMEKTPHVMLVGSGALKFALDNGFKKENLLTKETKAKWEKWLKDSKYKPDIKTEGHDTIGMLAIDNQGNISGACTTSGLAWKYHGRVGDSPIIGDGMFVDNEVGGAAATGKGEAVMKIAGSFLIVELMRIGKKPQQACELAIERIVKKQSDYKDFQVGFIALDKKGNYGAFSLQKGFQYALYRDDKNQLLDSNYYVRDEK